MRRGGGVLAAFALCLCACKPATAAALQDPVYFLVGAPLDPEERADGYVLPLTEPQHIAHARRIITEGQSAGRLIPVAYIEKGGDAINGDWVAPGTRLWCWRVTGFEDFGDITPEIYDGSPEGVERDVDGWIANTSARDGRGVIGFWNFTVLRELTHFPPLPGDANLDGQVNGSDFALLAGNFGRTGRDWYAGDFNFDRNVDGSDFALLASNFGRSHTGGVGGAALAPEPSAAWLAAVVAPLLRRHRPRRGKAVPT
jgi:hypothetical protein